MKDRYLAVIDPGAIARDRVADIVADARNRLGLDPAFACDQMVLLADRQDRVRPIDGGSILFGDVFARNSMASPARLSIAIPASGGRILIDDYWGDYVAFLVAPREHAVRVVRSPSGAIAAFRVVHDGLTIIASDLLALIDLGLVAARVDWTFVAHHLAYPHLRGGRTGIEKIDELFAGDCTILRSEGAARTCLWSPWAFADRSRWIDEADEAACRLQEVVLDCTRTLSHRFDKILLELSGGLDSSIVAASLARGSSELVCLNLVTPTAEGDERRYARDVAGCIGARLEEAFPDAEIDLAAPAHMRLARPGLPGVLRGWEYRFMSLAEELEADAFFGGTGGDNVFCSLGSAAPAADVLRTSGLGLRFIAVARDVAAVHDTTIWAVMRRAAAKARRPETATWPCVPDFLAATTLPEAPPFHPWLEEPANALGGTRSHIRSIMAVQAHLDGYARHEVAPSVFPLLAQPIVETCLQIPSWLWVRGGRDRSVARSAFADMLPPTIIHRRTKGMMNGYCMRIYNANRPRLRALLLEGHLARAGLLDLETLAAYLDAPGPGNDTLFYRVLAIADVEVWLRAWLDR